MSTTEPSQNAPWRDAETLRHLYHDEGLSQREVAERLGCAGSTVDKWMSKLGVEKRTKSDARGGGVSFRHTRQGYAMVVVSHGTHSTPIRVHQLVAIGNGADPYDIFSDGDYHVHHRNDHPSDNRPENLSVIRAGDHLREHGLHEEFHGPYTRDESGSWE
jgi:hypothetical protein